MKTILITGGAGMIGQEIVGQLADTGEWNIIVYDDNSNDYNENLPVRGGNIEYISPNFFGADYGSEIQTILESYSVDVISHQAARVGVGESMRKPEMYMMNNIGITAGVIQAIIDTKWKGLVIHAGSMAGYVDGYSLESSRLRPVSFYGLSKVTQEEMWRILSEAYNIPVVSLRYFSVYSTDFNPSNPFTGILNIIANQHLTGGKVEIYDDGNQTRDMINVKDVAEIHNRVAGRKWKGFEKVNVGTGVSRTIRDIVELMQLGIGEPLNVVFNGKKRAGDIYSSEAGIGKLKNLFLAPKEFRRLEDGIAEYCHYLKLYIGEVTPTVTAENDRLRGMGLVK